MYLNKVLKPPRIPGSRELFWVLRMSAFHPVVWDRDRFVRSGRGFAFLLGLVSVFSLRAAFDAQQNVNSATSLVKASDNPIRSDIDSFMKSLSSISHLTAFAHLIYFLKSRDSTALAFNELTSFWAA